MSSIRSCVPERTIPETAADKLTRLRCWLAELETQGLGGTDRAEKLRSEITEMEKAA
jgi:hypothetical protein